MMGWMAAVAASRCQNGSWLKHHRGEPSMSEIKTIGLDLAKHVFQVHGVDAAASLDRRRRSGPVITSTCAIAPSLAPVQTPSFAPVLQPTDQTPRARRSSPGGYRNCAMAVCSELDAKRPAAPHRQKRSGCIIFSG